MLDHLFGRLLGFVVFSTVHFFHDRLHVCEHLLDVLLQKADHAGLSLVDVRRTVIHRLQNVEAQNSVTAT